MKDTYHYVQDVSGNPMAIYQNSTPKEYPVYGSSRLGIFYKNTPPLGESEGAYLYQITDHLGNTRALIARDNSAIAGATDYYPGGMPMPGRNLQDAEGYRYGYQGEFAETDEETGKPAFKLRLYDPRINRWLSPDPYGQFHSPYLSMGNNWASMFDPDGGYCPKCPGSGTDSDPWVLDPVVLNGNSTPGYEDGLNYGGFDTSFSGSLPQWQEKFGTPGLSWQQEMSNWQANHAQDFANMVDRVNADWEKEAARRSAEHLMHFGKFLAMAWGMGGNYNLAAKPLSNTSYGFKGLTTPKPPTVHGNSLKSQKPTWFYKLYRNDGTFLKNGITNKIDPRLRYTRSYMADKFMKETRLFPNRLDAYKFEYQQNLTGRGPLNLNWH